MDNRCTLAFTGESHIDLMSGTSTICCKILPTKLDPIHGPLNKVALSVRKSIINNERSEYCKKCWDIDDLGGMSRRAQYSTHTTYDWESANIWQQVENIELKFSNKCQLQCSYCSGWNSSTWVSSSEEFDSFNKREYTYFYDDATVLTDILDIEKVKSIQITGGEPLLDQRCIDFLMNLPFNENRKLSLITNLSYGPSVMDTLLSIINRHKNININVSLDAIGENISRKYFNWNLWEKNFNMLLEDIKVRIHDYPTVIINVKSTISIMTYKTFPEVVEYILKLKRTGFNNVTFMIGTLFKSELTSLWSEQLEKITIHLSTADKLLLSSQELHQIDMFNNLISNVISEFDPTNPIVEKSNQYIKIYLK